MELKISHSAGYFSNMTIRLYELLDFMRKNGYYPKLDSSEQFGVYKEGNEDLSKIYIKEIDDEIPFNIPNLDKDFMSFQFDDYRTLDFEGLKPIIYKYFSIGDLIQENKDKIKKKYGLDKYISVFYRGNDKNTEITNPSYDLFIQKAKELEHLGLPYLVLPDECKFINEFKKHISNVITLDETPCIDFPDGNLMVHMPLNERPEYGAIYNAVVSLLSEGQYLITHSGNGGVWCCLYRGSADSVIQIYKDKVYSHE